MMLWIMEQATNAPGVFLNQQELIKTINAQGINPSHARSFIEHYNRTKVLSFSCINDAGDIINDAPTDIIFWSWMPIFSEFGRSILISNDVDPNDFTRCRFCGIDRDYYIHLPLRSFDAIAYKKSEFTMLIPLEPPLPFGAKRLTLKDGIFESQIPNVFRASIPGHSQVLSDLLVREKIRSTWIKASATGGKFRQITT